MVGRHEPDHVSVLTEEVITWLQPDRGGCYLDGTLGLGGHAEAILEKGGKETYLLGIDRDKEALAIARKRLSRFSGHAHFWHGSYHNFDTALQKIGWSSVHGVLLDLGVSSLQLDEPERGFSFLHDGPLDMRMDPTSDIPSARDLVNTASLHELKTILYTYGEEPMAARIARFILDAREAKPIETTGELADIVTAAYPAARRAKSRKHPATKTFQAFRLAVNSELDVLSSFLANVTDYMEQGARLAVISFHSLEDRIVKHTFRDLAKDCVCPREYPRCICQTEPKVKVLTKKPVYPGKEECERNFRSRSAKLRVAEKV